MRVELDDRDLGPPAPPASTLLKVPDPVLLARAERERAEVGPGAIRPFVKQLAERGCVSASEWSVPMNTYERRALLAELVDPVFLEHFLHCASNISAEGPRTYNWAVVHELVPEAQKRWQAYLRLQTYRNSNAFYGKMAVRDGWAGGATEVTERGWRRELDARSAYPAALLNPNAIHRVCYVAGGETLFALEIRGSIVGALLPAEGDLVSVSGVRYRVGRKSWELDGQTTSVTVQVQAEAPEALEARTEQDLEREARALIRRQGDGVDGLDWDRRVLARALQIQREEM